MLLNDFISMNIFLVLIFITSIFKLSSDSYSLNFFDGILAGLSMSFTYNKYLKHEDTPEEKDEKISRVLGLLTGQLNNILKEAQENENKHNKHIEDEKNKLSLKEIDLTNFFIGETDTPFDPDK
jgi:hypothetical protein